MKQHSAESYVMLTKIFVSLHDLNSTAVKKKTKTDWFFRTQLRTGVTTLNRHRQSDTIKRELNSNYRPLLK